MQMYMMPFKPSTHIPSTVPKNTLLIFIYIFIYFILMYKILEKKNHKPPSLASLSQLIFCKSEIIFL